MTSGGPAALRRYRVEVARLARTTPLVPERFIAPIAGLGDSLRDLEGDPLAHAVDANGERRLLAVRRAKGVRLGFDLTATLDAIRYEKYPGASLRHSIVSRLPFDYTRLPMWTIALAARILARRVELSTLPPYPRYPLDCSADLMAGLARGDLSSPPWSWPNRKRYVVALSHDVDTDWVFRHPRWLETCCEIEEGCGFRSAWYVVPRAAEGIAARRLLARLVARGHEVGLHGFEHDPRLPEMTEALLVRKFEQGRRLLRDYLEDAPGYRAPWLSRSESMYRALAAAGYLYDTSAPCSDFQRGNTDSNNGCGTLFPFSRAGLPVLPITVPQDSMAAAVRVGAGPHAFWDWIFGVIQQIKARGGLALVTTHLQPHHSANARMQEGYRRLLARLAEDEDAWLARPRDVVRFVEPLLEKGGAGATLTTPGLVR